MLKLIYYDDNEGYDTFSLANLRGIYECFTFLQGEGKVVICIINYKSSIIIFKCVGFRAHFDKIEHLIFDKLDFNT